MARTRRSVAATWCGLLLACVAAVLGGGQGALATGSPTGSAPLASAIQSFVTVTDIFGLSATINTLISEGAFPLNVGSTISLQFPADATLSVPRLVDCKLTVNDVPVPTTLTITGQTLALALKESAEALVANNPFDALVSCSNLLSSPLNFVSRALRFSPDNIVVRALANSRLYEGVREGASRLRELLEDLNCDTVVRTITHSTSVQATTGVITFVQDNLPADTSFPEGTIFQEFLPAGWTVGALMSCSVNGNPALASAEKVYKAARDEVGEPSLAFANEFYQTLQSGLFPAGTTNPLCETPPCALGSVISVVIPTELAGEAVSALEIACTEIMTPLEAATDKSLQLFTNGLARFVRAAGDAAEQVVELTCPPSSVPAITPPFTITGASALENAPCPGGMGPLKINFAADKLPLSDVIDSVWLLDFPEGSLKVSTSELAATACALEYGGVDARDAIPLTLEAIDETQLKLILQPEALDAAAKSALKAADAYTLLCNNVIRDRFACAAADFSALYYQGTNLMGKGLELSFGGGAATTCTTKTALPPCMAKGALRTMELTLPSLDVSIALSDKITVSLPSANVALLPFSICTATLTTKGVVADAVSVVSPNITTATMVGVGNPLANTLTFFYTGLNVVGGTADTLALTCTAMNVKSVAAFTANVEVANVFGMCGAKFAYAVPAAAAAPPTPCALVAYEEPIAALLSTIAALATTTMTVAVAPSGCALELHTGDVVRAVLPKSYAFIPNIAGVIGSSCVLEYNDGSAWAKVPLKTSLLPTSLETGFAEVVVNADIGAVTAARVVCKNVLAVGQSSSAQSATVTLRRGTSSCGSIVATGAIALPAVAAATVPLSTTSLPSTPSLTNMFGTSLPSCDVGDIVTLKWTVFGEEFTFPPAEATDAANKFFTTVLDSRAFQLLESASCKLWEMTTQDSVKVVSAIAGTSIVSTATNTVGFDPSDVVPAGAELLLECSGIKMLLTEPDLVVSTLAVASCGALGSFSAQLCTAADQLTSVLSDAIPFTCGGMTRLGSLLREVDVEEEFADLVALSHRILVATSELLSETQLALIEEAYETVYSALNVSASVIKQVLGTNVLEGATAVRRTGAVARVKVGDPVVFVTTRLTTPSRSTSAKKMTRDLATPERAMALNGAVSSSTSKVSMSPFAAQAMSADDFAHCTNELLDDGLGETDVDCGGPDCAQCKLGKNCGADNLNCFSGACVAGVCAAAPPVTSGSASGSQPLVLGLAALAAASVALAVLSLAGKKEKLQ